MDVVPDRLRALDLLIDVDPVRGGHVGRQLEAQLRDAIRSGAFPAGTVLPSSRALAGDLSVSRGVVVRAYAQLAAEGYVEIRQGAKARVRGIHRETSATSPMPNVLELVPKPRFDLRPHQPDVGAFPRSSWLRSVRHALNTGTNAELGYTGPPGLEQLRVELAGYLSRARGVAADPDRIVVTLGSTHTLSLISKVLIRQGAERLAFENPTHWVLQAVVRHAGLEPVGVPVDEQGIRVDELPEAKVPAVLVSPAHQFPTGVAMSADRRAALALWARESGGLIIEDDYDAEFRYDRTPVGALQGLLPEQVAYMGSTGKTLSPAIRLGWAVLPTDLVGPVCKELVASVLQVPGIDQLALADFLQRGELDRHMRRMRTIYRGRRNAFVDALTTRLSSVNVSGIAAGLHIVVDLDSPAHEEAVRTAAEANGIVVESIGQHALPGWQGQPGLLIGYGTIAEPTIPFIAERLAALIASLPQTSPSQRKRARRA